MNKSELISAVAAKAEISKKDAEKAVNAVFAGISDSLASGEGVQIIGFGSFEVRDRAAKAVTPERARPSQFPQQRFPHSKQAPLLKKQLQNN